MKPKTTQTWTIEEFISLTCHLPQPLEYKLNILKALSTMTVYKVF